MDFWTSNPCHGPTTACFRYLASNPGRRVAILNSMHKNLILQNSLSPLSTVSYRVGILEIWHGHMVQDHIWSRTIWSWTMWSWTIHNLKEFSKSDNNWNAHCSRSVFAMCSWSRYAFHNGPGACLTSKILSDCEWSGTIRSLWSRTKWFWTHRLCVTKHFLQYFASFEINSII